MKPFFKKIMCDLETPASLFSRFALRHPYAFMYESAETHERIGRYSFLGFDAISLHIFPAGGKENPLKILEKSFNAIHYESDPKLPRLQAGFIGYFSYEVASHFENLPLPREKSAIPEGIFFLPRYLLVFDHFERSLTLIAYNKKDFKNLIKEYEKNAESHPLQLIPIETAQIVHEENRAFFSMVNKAKEKICAGEIFQVVLSQIFKKHTSLSAFDLYRRLRLISPSPYMYFLKFPEFSIVGSSPETLVRTEGDDIVLRPIAGTRPRGKNPEENKKLEEELRNDPKEQAEHMMLVDLGRNDVGRIALPGSVRVTQLMEIERYSHVLHLVSEIRGKRGPNTSLFDIFKTAFPAGTLTGAPKIRAMEIIAELEKKPRDIYGGAVGYFDLSGNLDFAIAIRTMLYQEGLVTLHAGAGIVYDSTPDREHRECMNKALAPLTSLV